MPQTNASAAIAWKACHRRAWYDMHDPGSAEPPDKFNQLIMQAGIEHERAVLATLDSYTKARDEVHTAQLMESHTPIIYQPKFRDDTLGVVAQPDFLFLEADGYRAADAKLAGSIKDKPGLRIQLAVYQRVLRSDLPAKALLGNGEEALIGAKDLDRADEFIASMKHLADSPRPEVHFGNTKCSLCAYRSICIPEFQANGDLGQNYFLRAEPISHLRARGIHTLADLAKQDPEALPEVPHLKGDTRRLAVLHAKALVTGNLIVLEDPAPIPGTPIHFDIESKPQSKGSPEEVYLWGFLMPPYAKEDFEYVWHDGGADADRNGWHQFLAVVAEQRKRYPDAVYVHYARFEHDAIKRYAQRFGDQSHPVVEWLLKEDGLLDLCEMVKDSVVLPTYGYGLKEVCKAPNLVNFQWELQESGSQWSVVRYMDFLGAEDERAREEIKSEVLAYNRDDVRATRALEMWLAGLKA